MHLPNDEKKKITSNFSDFAPLTSEIVISVQVMDRLLRNVMVMATMALVLPSGMAEYRPDCASPSVWARTTNKLKSASYAGNIDCRGIMEAGVVHLTSGFLFYTFGVTKSLVLWPGTKPDMIKTLQEHHATSY